MHRVSVLADWWSSWHDIDRTAESGRTWCNREEKIWNFSETGLVTTDTGRTIRVNDELPIDLANPTGPVPRGRRPGLETVGRGVRFWLTQLEPVS
jgi:hypothetical protein